jgi:hypothetical protein
MDINIGETPAGRLKMELFSDIVPKSAAHPSLRWFRLLTRMRLERRKTSDSFAPENSGVIKSQALLLIFNGGQSEFQTSRIQERDVSQVGIPSRYLSFESHVFSECMYMLFALTALMRTCGICSRVPNFMCQGEARW